MEVKNNNIETTLKLEKEKLIDIDLLANINNRSKFMLNCRKILLSQSDYDNFLIRFDIKKFRYINQVYGYSYGDVILNYIAEELERCTNEGELYGRGYDDNFLLLLRMDKGNSFNSRLNSIIDSLNSIKDKINKHLKINYSFGVYKIKDLNESIESMIDKAYIAQKFIKVSGNYKECYAYYKEEMKQSIIEEKVIEDKMYNALKNDEFKIYLQPKNELENLNFSGAEALVRWQDGENEIIYPDKFIPVFEKNGFVVEVDFYVLEEVCRHMRNLLDRNIDVVPISVNQSKKHLDNADYFTRVESIIKKYDIPENLIEFEITEISALYNSDELIEVVKKLHDIGIKIAIDDFGTGYSSLNLLKEIDVDILKIDREFLNTIETCDKSKIIIKHIIKMAEELNMITVTEGVENKNQEAFLKQIGCDMAQGYLYSRPIPIDEFEKKYYNV